jgi:hypothetical protein
MLVLHVNKQELKEFPILSGAMAQSKVIIPLLWSLSD